jgi:hypothetical protein
VPRDQPVVATGDRLDAPLLVLTGMRRPLQDRCPVGGGRAGNVQRLSVEPRNQSIVAIAGRFDAPLLVLAAVTRELDRGRTVREGRAAHVETLAALSSDQLVRACGQHSPLRDDNGELVGYEADDEHGEDEHRKP